MDERRLRIAFALPGFHRVDRGAEVALLAVADGLARLGHEVTVFGSGVERPATAYRFQHVPAVAREYFERFPKFAPFRSDVIWEDATFALGLLRRYRPADYDATFTCSFPFTQLVLRRAPWGGAAPKQIFVTQNGDWPARATNSEYRLFRCDGLVCINPDYYADNQDRWPCVLIPNGADLARFKPGQGARARFGLPDDRPVILMVSALIESKRVIDGIRAVSRLERAHLVVAGDGPLRDDADGLAAQLLPGRYTRLTLSAAEMPELYRSADVMLHMSLAESFGNVFVEAMACGLPIVGHDSPRLRWIVGTSAFLCDTRDADDLRAALQAAIARRKGDIPAEVARFSWQAIAREYAAFLLARCGHQEPD